MKLPQEREVPREKKNWEKVEKKNRTREKKKTKRTKKKIERAKKKIEREFREAQIGLRNDCLFYTSDAAADRLAV